MKFFFGKNLLPVSILFFYLIFSASLFAQKKNKPEVIGSLELVGLAREAGTGIPGSEIKIKKENGEEFNFTSGEGGKFLFTIPLNNTCLITFSKPGYLPRTVEVSSKVPDAEKSIVYSYKFNIELFPVNTRIPHDLLDIPASKIYYDEGVQDFEFDRVYTKKLQDEIRKFKEELETAMRDSLLRSKLLADSTLRIQRTADSLARMKFVSDTMRLAETKRKNFSDSIALAGNRKKAIRDSLWKASVDSMAKADLRKKQVSDSISKIKADSVSLAEMRKKTTQDSAGRAELRKKMVRDSIAKAVDDSLLIVRKKAISNPAGSNGKDGPTSALPKLKSNYPEGVSEEILIEPKRKIERMIVNRGGILFALNKVTYDWGGIFFFKDESPISESGYLIEVKQAKEVKKQVLDKK